MWCSTCQQDTPGIPQGVHGRIVCSRCQHTVSNYKQSATVRICDDGIPLDAPVATASAAPPTPPRRDDWQARKRSRSLARELKRPGIVATATSNLAATSRLRFEPPQDLFSDSNSSFPPTYKNPDALPASISPSRPARENSPAAWLVVALGIFMLASGIGLGIWSISTNYLGYWNLALGLAMGGQGLLITGLVLVVSRLWRHSRYAAGKLQEVHTNLRQLQQTAEILTTMRTGGSAPTFYADLARGSSPHILLANLKGQLDQLATRVAGGP